MTAKARTLAKQEVWVVGERNQPDIVAGEWLRLFQGTGMPKVYWYPPVLLVVQMKDCPHQEQANAIECVIEALGL